MMPDLLANQFPHGVATLFLLAVACLSCGNICDEAASIQCACPGFVVDLRHIDDPAAPNPLSPAPDSCGADAHTRAVCALEHAGAFCDNACALGELDLLAREQNAYLMCVAEHG